MKNCSLIFCFILCLSLFFSPALLSDQLLTESQGVNFYVHDGEWCASNVQVKAEYNAFEMPAEKIQRDNLSKLSEKIKSYCQLKQKSTPESIYVSNYFRNDSRWGVKFVFHNVVAIGEKKTSEELANYHYENKPVSNIRTDLPYIGLNMKELSFGTNQYRYGTLEYLTCIQFRRWLGALDKDGIGPAAIKAGKFNSRMGHAFGNQYYGQFFQPPVSNFSVEQAQIFDNTYNQCTKNLTHRGKEYLSFNIFNKDNLAIHAQALAPALKKKLNLKMAKIGLYWFDSNFANASQERQKQLNKETYNWFREGGYKCIYDTGFFTLSEKVYKTEQEIGGGMTMGYQIICEGRCDQVNYSLYGARGVKHLNLPGGAAMLGVSNTFFDRRDVIQIRRVMSEQVINEEIKVRVLYWMPNKMFNYGVDRGCQI